MFIRGCFNFLWNLSWKIHSHHTRKGSSNHWISSIFHEFEYWKQRWVSLFIFIWYGTKRRIQCTPLSFFFFSFSLLYLAQTLKKIRVFLFSLLLLKRLVLLCDINSHMFINIIRFYVWNFIFFSICLYPFNSLRKWERW